MFRIVITATTISELKSQLMEALVGFGQQTFPVTLADAAQKTMNSPALAKIAETLVDHNEKFFDPRTVNTQKIIEKEAKETMMANPFPATDSKPQTVNIAESLPTPGWREKAQERLDKAFPGTASIAEPEADEDDEPAPRANQSPKSHDMNDLDTRGFPWDKRIHSNNKTKNSDGTWRVRRNLENGAVEMVERELKARYIQLSVEPVAIKSTWRKEDEPIPFPAGPLTPPSQPPVVPQAAPSIAQLFNTAEPKVELSPSPIIPSPPPPTVKVDMPVNLAPVLSLVPEEPKKSFEAAPVPMGDARPAYDFQSFCKNFISFMTTLVQQNKVDRAYIESLNKYFDVKDIWDVMKSEPKMIEIFNTFAQCGFLTKVG